MEAIILILVILAGLYYFFFMAERKPKTEKGKIESANEFVNIKDITEDYLYTLDGYIMKYIRVFPISLELLSDKAKENLAIDLANHLSQVNKLEFKFVAVSRPVDISPLISEYQAILRTTTNKWQRESLKKEILELSKFATGGEVNERQFYFCLWEVEQKEEELKERVRKFLKAFEESNLKVSVLNKREMIALANMINHPHTFHLDNFDIENIIPSIMTIEKE
ncbi:MAG: hypothetical protein Q4A29_07790 [Eubacteriales bacterium]|nr:hypothetical protein [Eubacteriales bacterium]